MVEENSISWGNIYLRVKKYTSISINNLIKIALTSCEQLTYVYLVLKTMTNMAMTLFHHSHNMVQKIRNPVDVTQTKITPLGSFSSGLAEYKYRPNMALT